jgi:hypothetical protein
MSLDPKNRPGTPAPGAGKPAPPSSPPIRSVPKPGTLAALYDDDVASVSRDSRPAVGAKPNATPPRPAAPVSKPSIANSPLPKPAMPNVPLPRPTIPNLPIPRPVIPKAVPPRPPVPNQSTAKLAPPRPPVPSPGPRTPVPLGPVPSAAKSSSITPARPLPPTPTPRQPISRPQMMPATPARSGVVARPRQTELCDKCGETLSGDSLARGVAQFLDGKLICERCHRKIQDKIKKQTLRPMLYVVPALILTVVGAIFFPAQMIFLGLLAALLGVVVVAFSSSLRPVIRLGLVAAGLCVAGACFWGLTTISERKKAAQIESRFGSIKTEIEGLLAQNEFVAANTRRVELQTEAESARDAQALKVAEPVDKLFEDWFNQRYKNADSKGHTILARLLLAYPVKSANGTMRFTDFRINTKTIVLVFTTDWLNTTTVETAKGPVTVSVDALNECAAITRFLYTNMPQADAVEFTLLNADGGSSMGKFIAPKQAFMKLSIPASMQELITLYQPEPR